MSSTLYNNQDNKPLQNAKGNSPGPSAMSLLRWWYNLSAPPDVAESATFFLREQVRRGRVASMIILGMLVACVSLVPFIILATPDMFFLNETIATTAAGMFCCLLAIPFNRNRQVQLAGILLIIAVNVIVAGIVLSERDGLNPLFLTMFDLLVVSELIAASLLTPASVFVIALINALMIVLDVNFQPHSMMWMQMVMTQELAYSLLARPIALYLVVAAVAYLWVRSALKALQRADRAELIAELERRESEQKRQLEQEIEQILMIHVRVANGDLNARAPTYQDHALWKIGIALNNLLARLKSAYQAEQNLHRVTEEISQLRMALRHWQSGQPLQWYPSREVLLTLLGTDLRRALMRAPTAASLAFSAPPQQFAIQEGHSEQKPYSPGSAPSPNFQQQRQFNEAARRSNPARPGNTSMDTPFFGLDDPIANQKPRPQVPETPLPPYSSLDNQNNIRRRAEDR